MGVMLLALPGLLPLSGGSRFTVCLGAESEIADRLMTQAVDILSIHVGNG
jgi:hypothetical protein